MTTTDTQPDNLSRSPALAPVNVDAIVMLPCEGSEGPCNRKDATHYRQNTRYANEEDNWRTLCPECRRNNDAYWADMWADYYRDCL